MSSTKKSCLCAVCVALCAILPQAFHAVGLGWTFSPMHIPVLLCGLICGAPYGAVCGIIGPALSCVITSMPSAPQLLHMIPELVTYGLCAGLGMGLIRSGHLYPDLYLTLIPAMLLGRIVGGVAQAVVYLSSAREYSVAMWAGSFLIATAPGAVVHLIVLPILVLALMKAKVIPERYPLQKQPA